MILKKKSHFLNGKVFIFVCLTYINNRPYLEKNVIFHFFRIEVFSNVFIRYVQQQFLYLEQLFFLNRNLQISCQASSISSCFLLSVDFSLCFELQWFEVQLRIFQFVFFICVFVLIFKPASIAASVYFWLFATNSFVPQISFVDLLISTYLPQTFFWKCCPGIFPWFYVILFCFVFLIFKTILEKQVSQLHVISTMCGICLQKHLEIIYES